MKICQELLFWQIKNNVPQLHALFLVEPNDDRTIYGTKQRRHGKYEQFKEKSSNFLRNY